MSAKSIRSLVRSWETVRFELLKGRISDLPLAVEGSPLERYVRRLRREMDLRGFLFKPDVYLTDGWGCPDRSPVIGVPFYLADPRLARLEEEQTGEVEDPRTIMMLLRHEAGHAVNYAYRLYERKEWRDLFGDFSKRYPTRYRTKPWSKKHVQHLDLVYAQRHPDDDWAESFAVWLTPGINWRRRYKGWDAIEKLIYVDIIMKQLGRSAPTSRRVAYDAPARKERRTLAELYDVEPVAALSEEEMEDYIKDLGQIFLRRVRRREYHVPAADFLRRYREAIVSGVARWIMHSNKNSVRKIIRRLKSVCRHYGLVMIRSEGAEKLAEVTALVTWYVINDIYDLA